MQGKYWESLELLFKHQPVWGSHHAPKPHLIYSYLESINLDITKLRKDMLNPILDQNIAQDRSDLRDLNVRGTPTFFVNGNPLQAFGIEFLEEAIKKEVDSNY